MKFTVDVDCTAEEARAFLGLPDLSSVHDIYIDKMKAALGDQAGPEMFGEMIKAWGPMSDAGMGMWRQLLDPASRKSSS